MELYQYHPPNSSDAIDTTQTNINMDYSSPIRRKTTETLSDFIQSPQAIRQREMEQYKRKIRMLTADLETERDAKDDLLKELQEKQANMIRLVKEMENKNQFIRTLTQQTHAEDDTDQCQSPKIKLNMQKYTRMKADLKRLNEQNDQLQSDLTTTVEENQSLINRINIKDKENQNLFARLSTVESENSELSYRAKHLETKLNQQQKDYNELHNIYKEIQMSQMNKSSSSDSFLLAEPENLEPVIDLQLKEAEQRTKQLEDALNSITIEKCDVEQKLEDAQKLIDEKTREIDVEKDKCQAIQNKLDQMEIEFLTEKTQLNKVSKLYETLTDENERLKKLVDDVKLEKEDIKKILEVAIVGREEAKRELEAIIEDNNARKTMINVLEEELVRYEKDLNVEKIFNAEKMAEVERLNESNALHKEEERKLEEMIQDKHRKIGELNEEKNRKIDDLLEKIDELTRLRESDRKVIELNELDKSKLFVELEQLKCELEKSFKKNSTLSTALNEMEDLKMKSQIDLSEKITESKARVNQLEQKIHELVKQCAEKDQNIEVLEQTQRENEEKMAQNAVKIVELEGIKREHAKITEEIILKQLKIDELVKENQTLEENLAKLTENIENERRKLNAEITGHKKSFDEKLFEIAELQRSIITKNEEINEMRETLSSEKIDNERKIIDLNAKVVVLEEEKQSLTVDLVELKRTSENDRKLIELKEVEQSKLQRELDQIKCEREESSKKYSVLLDEFNQSKLSAIQLETDLNEKNKQLSQDFMHIQAKNNELERIHGEIQVELKESKAIIDQQNAKIHELSEQCVENDRNIENLKQTVSINEQKLAENAKIFVELKEIQRDYANMSAEIVEKNREIDELMRESKVSEKNLLRKIEEIEIERESEREKLHKSLEQTKIELNESITKYDALLDDYNALKNLKIKCELDLNEKLDQINALSEDLNVVQTKNNDLERIHGEVEAKVFEFKARVEQLELKIDQLVNQCMEKDRNIEILKQTQRENDQKLSENAVTIAALEQIQREHVKMTEELNVKQLEIERLTVLIGQFDVDRQNLLLEITEKNVQNDNLTRKTKEMETLNEKINEQSKLIQKLTKQKVALEKKMKNMEEEKIQKLEQLINEIKTLKDYNAELKEKYANNDNERIGQLETEIAAVTQLKSTLESQLNTVSVRLNEVLVKNTFLNEAKSKSDALITQLEASQLNARVACERLKVEKEVAEKELARQVEKYEQFKAKSLQAMQGFENERVEFEKDGQQQVQKIREKMIKLHEESVAKLKAKHTEEITKLHNDYEEKIHAYKKQLIVLQSRAPISSRPEDVNVPYSRQSLALRIPNQTIDDFFSEPKTTKNVPFKNKVAVSVAPSRTTSCASLNDGFGVKKNLPMEDEVYEILDNKSLSSLKMPEYDPMQRLTELQRRNTLCKPHLKSSYAVETQCLSSVNFKENDLKFGETINLDDSTTQLLDDKPRKKDRGTTSYKKPGPPTPSKNGGRPSFHTNDRDILKDISQDPNNQPPKRRSSTPKSLLTSWLPSRNHAENHSENPTTPRSGTRRLSIFRR